MVLDLGVGDSDLDSPWPFDAQDVVLVLDVGQDPACFCLTFDVLFLFLRGSVIVESINRSNKITSQLPKVSLAVLVDIGRER